MMIQLDQFQVKNCKLDDLIRLCRWLGIPDGSDNKRQSLINWLVHEGYVKPR